MAARVRTTLLLITAMAFTVAFSACGLLDPNPGPNPIATGKSTGGGARSDTALATVERGISLYAQNCARCHGDSAQGTVIWQPSIQGKSGIHDQVRNGQKAMPAFPGLSDSAIKSIELYLQSFNVNLVSKSGRALYVAYCSTCHGDSAQGIGVYGGFPGKIQAYTPIHDIVKNGRGQMKAVPLSDTLISLIQAYLLTFKPPTVAKTGRDYYISYCASCHGDSAQGSRAPASADAYSGSIQAYTPIHDIVRNGKLKMKAVVIHDTVIAKIQDYLNSFKIDWLSFTGAQYYARECARCHGASGEGTVRGYDIRNPVTGYAGWVVRNGRPGTPYFSEAMPKYASTKLSDNQMSQIITWLRQASHPTTGKELYNRFCANCHGADARGGPCGVGIKNELGGALSKCRSGNGGTTYSNRRTYMPKWTAAELSDAEINLMISYVRTLP